MKPWNVHFHPCPFLSANTSTFLQIAKSPLGSLWLYKPFAAVITAFSFADKRVLHVRSWFISLCLEQFFGPVSSLP